MIGFLIGAGFVVVFFFGLWLGACLERRTQESNRPVSIEPKCDFCSAQPVFSAGARTACGAHYPLIFREMSKHPRLMA